MCYILFRYSVSDYQKWKEFFDSERQNRKANGEQSYHLLHEIDSESDLTILHTWDKKDNARKYFETIEFRQSMKNSGVVAKPEMVYLETLEMERKHGIRKSKQK